MKNTIKLLFLGLIIFGITATRAQISTATGGEVLANIPATNTNVGIGTSNPDEKLTAKGKTHAEEIKVDFAVPADYVFPKDYTVKSILKSDFVMSTPAEIETFTKKNHYLPIFPSAQETQINCFALGKMSNVLRQKV
jgi:hypothetical protein